MADEPSQPGANAEKSETPQSPARAWLILFGGFTSVLMLGACLAVVHVATRRSRLEEHYDRAAARTASQVGLRWQNAYRRLAAMTNLQAAQGTAAGSAAAEDDGLVTIGDCLAEAQSRGVFVNAAGTAFVKRITDAPQGPTALRPQCATVMFSSLLKGPRSGLAENRGPAQRFDQVFLAEGSGRVLAEERTSPQLTLEALPIAPDNLGAAPAPTSFSLGPTEYRAFVRRVRVEGQQSERLPSILVCGLLRERALIDESVRMESSYALVGLFLLVMATVALPSAKLWLVGRHVRYHRRDVRLFQIATVVGFMLTVVLCLGFAAREALHAKLGTKLEAIAVKLGDDVGARIASSAKALHAFAQQARPFVTATAGMQVGAACQPVEAFPAPASMASFPQDWNVVFRLDAQGRQVDKNYRTTATPCVSVPERSYFRAVQNGRLRDLRQLAVVNQPGKSQDRLLGAAEIVRSRTTGKTTLIVAMPDAKHAEFTLALETSLGQLTTQLLPRAVQTAVIDPRGRVMLHSDNASFQEQSLFDDVDASALPALRAAIEARYKGPVTLEYLGAPSTAYLYPLQAGWTALSVAPSALLDLPTRQVVFLTLLLCLASLFLLLCLALPVLFGRVFDAEARGHAEDVSLLPEQTPPGRLTYYGLPQTPLREEESGLSPSSASQGVEEKPAPRPRLEALSAAFVASLKSYAQHVTAYAGVQSLLRIGVAASLTTGCLFWVAYEQVVEDYVAIGLQHAADQRVRLPECFASSSKCVALYDPQVAKPDPSESGSKIGGLTASVLDLVLPLAALESDVLSLPPREPPQAMLPWSFARHGRRLELRSKANAFTLVEEIPGMLSGLCAEASVFALLATLFSALVLAAFAAWTSFRRLTFARTKVKPREDVSAAALVASDRERVLVHYPQPDLEQALRALHLREMQPGDDPGSAPAFIAHVERHLRNPTALVKTIQDASGRLILLSGVDWTRWLAPEEREALDQAFAPFAIVHGPGLKKWPALPAERRALASTLWATCNPSERSVLARIALDGYVAPHPDNESVIVHLRDRGILSRARIAFAEPDFRVYVRYTASAGVLRSSSDITAQQNDAWNRIRVPLSTAALLVLAVVSFMQPELTALGLPISSALAALRPLLKTLGLSGDGG